MYYIGLKKLSGDQFPSGSYEDFLNVNIIYEGGSISDFSSWFKN